VYLQYGFLYSILTRPKFAVHRQIVSSTSSVPEFDAQLFIKIPEYFWSQPSLLLLLLLFSIHLLMYNKKLIIHHLHTVTLQTCLGYLVWKIKGNTTKLLLITD
jgi:hypothetical protein